MIRYLVVAIVLILVAACGEPTPTPWPTTTPGPLSESTAAGEAESTEVPDSSSGVAATVIPAETPGIVHPGIAARRARLKHHPVRKIPGVKQRRKL